MATGTSASTFSWSEEAANLISVSLFCSLIAGKIEAYSSFAAIVSLFLSAILIFLDTFYTLSLSGLSSSDQFLLVASTIIFLLMTCCSLFVGLVNSHLVLLLAFFAMVYPYLRRSARPLFLAAVESFNNQASEFTRQARSFTNAYNVFIQEYSLVHPQASRSGLLPVATLYKAWREFRKTPDLTSREKAQAEAMRRSPSPLRKLMHAVIYLLVRSHVLFYIILVAGLRAIARLGFEGCGIRITNEAHSEAEDFKRYRDFLAALVAILATISLFVSLRLTLYLLPVALWLGLGTAIVDAADNGILKEKGGGPSSSDGPLRGRTGFGSDKDGARCEERIFEGWVVLDNDYNMEDE